MTRISLRNASLRGTALALLVWYLAANPVSAAAADCAGLQSNAPRDAQITAVTLQPAGPFVIPPDLGPARTVQLPALCRVQGVLRPTSDSSIGFEVWLPAEGWNGRFLGVGNGGFAGSIGYASLAAAVQSRYAAASTDTGHAGGLTDAGWAVGHPEKVIDFGWRAVHLTTVAGKELTATFYGKPANYSYFSSCSNGGRQGLMEAQRFPEDYDGIIAGAPAYRWTGLFTSFVWNAQALAKPGAAIPAAKTPAIARAVLDQCDARDGLPDGLVSDPRHCRVDLRKLRCTESESDSCLTPPQITALQAIYQGAHTSQGKQIYFGFPPGGEAAPGSAGWDAWIFGAAPGASIQNAFGSSFVKQIVGAPASWTPAEFDFDRDFGPLEARTAATFNATSPDLSRFAAHGGRLILWHGWSDAAIPAQGTIDYRDNVVRRMGEKQAGQFVRLFMVPGMHHCAGGTGPSDFGQNSVPAADDSAATSVLAALQEWVEEGHAPEQLIAKQQTSPGSTAADQPVRTGLICAYPKRAELKRGADSSRAESYTCRGP
jgi:feruloyl esterase